MPGCNGYIVRMSTTTNPDFHLLNQYEQAECRRLPRHLQPQYIAQCVTASRRTIAR